MLVLLSSRIHAVEKSSAERALELVRAATSGSTAAQGELFRQHAPQLLIVLRRLLSSVSDAEDAVQDTFVHAFAELPTLRDPAAFEGWLRQIAVHQAHRRFRRRRLLGLIGLGRRPDGDDALLANESIKTASAETIAELALIDRVLAKLDTDDRIAWMLRHVEGYELLEVADACRCSLATVKRRIDRAEQQIQKRIGSATGGKGRDS